MKKWLKSILFVGLVSLAFGFVSCAADSGDSTETQPQVQVQTTYYTVSFNSNGGSSVSAQKVESGKTATKPSNPIKEGYSFRGWYNGTSEFDFSTPIKSNITLTAQWTENKTTPETPKNPETPETPETPQNPDTPENPDSPDNPSTPTVTTYTLTFKANGGTGDDTTQTVTFGKTATLNSNTFTYAGYRFASWNTKADGTGNSYSDGGDFTVSEEKNITLYAQWVENDRYIISYANTHEATNTNPTSYRETVGATLSDLFLTGYIFEGWYSDADADGNGTRTKITGWGAGEKSGDITLWAKWTVNSCTITFNANNSTGARKSQTVTFGTSANLDTNSFDYAGYRFADWNTAQDGSGSSYSDGGDFSVTETSDITLYAQWIVADKFVIAYENTREAENTNPTSYRGIEGATLSDLSLTGYIFEGWYSESDTDGNGTGTKITGWGANEKTGDVTLWAKWTPRTDTAYKVEHWQENENDDSYTLFESENMSGTTDAQTNAEEKSYAHFTAQAITQETIASNGSTVVKVYYERERVTLTLNLDGGTLGGESGTVTKTGKYGQTVAIANPTKTGFAFAGWNENDGTLPTSYTEDAEYTAVWSTAKIVSFTVNEESDISVGRQQEENTITFTADECDSYAWYFNDAKVATTRQYEIDLSTLAKGTYGLALEAQKDGKLYSYFTQIKVEN